ncbi:MAG: nucleotide exchange factor GrpE [Chloroflexota bacterium]|nr:nucleotide exchange factor GrpE [Chloroflexota bacterium]
MAEADPREPETPGDPAPQADDENNRPTIRVTDRRAASSSDDQPAAEASQSESGESETDLERRHRDVLNRLTRSQADFANYRRRTEAEARERTLFANMAIAFDILRVIDGFERAFETLPGELRLLSWVDGIALTQAQLLGALEAHGVKPIECTRGDPIDTSIHEVVMSDDGEGPMAVAEQLQRGYRMHDRVLRPTLVKAAPAASLASESDGTGSDDATPAASGAG